MKITVETNIAMPVDTVWRDFNNPDDIVQWDASDDWHTTWASKEISGITT